MRKIIVIVCFLSVQLLCSVAFGQKVIVTKYFSKYDIEVSREQSYYYEVKNEKFSKGDTVTTFYTSSDKVRSLSVVGENGSPNGFFLRFHENGQLKSKGIPKYGSPSGVIVSYYPNGKIQAREFFNNESMITESALIDYYDSAGNQLVTEGNGKCGCHFNSFDWNSFLETGNLVDGMKDSVWSGFDTRVSQKFIEHYDKGKFLSGESYDSLGTTYKYHKIEESPEYKGGLEAMYKKLAKTMRYPADARKSGVEGAVFIGFIVNKDGSLHDIKIIKGIHASCDAQALQSVKALKEWMPGKIRGVPVNVKFVLPIRFRI